MFFAAFRPTEIEQIEDFEVVSEELETLKPEELYRDETTMEIRSREVSEIEITIDTSTTESEEKETAELPFDEGEKPTIKMKIMVPESVQSSEGTINFHTDWYRQPYCMNGVHYILNVSSGMTVISTLHASSCSMNERSLLISIIKSEMHAFSPSVQETTTMKANA